MNGKMLGLLIVASVIAAGCSPQFWGGGAAGVLGAGAGYEVHAKQQLKQIDEDLAAGRIDQREHDIRKDQIQRDSVLQ
jgi:hypothetical protein